MKVVNKVQLLRSKVGEDFSTDNVIIVVYYFNNYGVGWRKVMSR